MINTLISSASIKSVSFSNTSNNLLFNKELILVMLVYVLN